jgi:TolB-like protein/DNA-binding winged helix-turn-helix (wHTH) protein/cytochrome c-type biogenesis protein CcmH/NrfG
MQDAVFGPFQLDLKNGELRKAGATLKLQPQPARLLTLLVSRAGQLVTREEIRSQLWGSETFVDFDQSVNFCIRQIRATLHDDADRPCYVETVPRRGYRFIAPVRLVVESKATPAAIPETGRMRMYGQWRPRLTRAFLAIAAVAVIAALTAAILYRRDPDRLTGEPVWLAVLPFESLDGQEYFADGMTDEVISELARLHMRLRVIERASVMAYKRTPKTFQQVGRELGVAYVLLGTVRRSSGQMQIAVQLVNTAENRRVWTQIYNRPLADALIIRRELARSVADHTQPKLTSEEQHRLATVRPIDPGAHEQLLMGRYFLGKANRADTMKAIEFFEAAVAKDADYAEAYAGLAAAYNRLGTVFIAGRPPGNTRMLAVRAATRAMELDPDLADGYAAFGDTMLHELDWVQAEKALTHAVQANPSDAGASSSYASYLIARGRGAEAVEEARRSLALDPVSLGARHTLAWMLYFNHEYDAAIRELETTLRMDPSYAFGRWRLGQVKIVVRQFEDAARELERAAHDSGRAPAVLGLLAMAYAGLGRHVAAQRLVDELEARSSRETVPPGAIALAYLGAGDTSHAIASLQQVYDSHDNYAIYIRVDPLLDSLRTDPRFQLLCRRLE